MARLSFVASVLAILPLSSSRFCPLAPLLPHFRSLAGTLLLILTGWHPTATLRLAPYCYSSSAGIPSARWLRSSSTLLTGGPLLGYA